MRYWLGPWQLDERGAWERPAGTVACFDLRPLPVQAQTVDGGAGLFVTPDDVHLSGYELLGQGAIADVRLSLRARQAWRGAMGGALPSASRLDALVWDAVTAGADETGERGPRPLMPTTRGLMALSLAGEEFGRARFDAASPAGQAVLRNLRHDYRGVRDDAINGRLRGPNGVDPQYHRRVLDVWCTKYRLAEDAFIPPDLPRETRLPHATSYTESFNQADSTTLGPDLTWTELQTRWETVSNQLYTLGDSSSFTDSRCRADHDVSSDDHVTQIDAVGAAGGLSFVGWGACARYSSSADTCYVAWLYRNTDNLYVSKIVAGARTNLANTAVTRSLPDELRCECEGSAIRGYFNGTAVTTTTDTSITSGKRGGVHAGGGASGGITYDGFSVADLAAGGSPVPVLYHHRRMQGMS